MSVNGTRTASTSPPIVYGSTGGEAILPDNANRYYSVICSETTQNVYLKLGSAGGSTDYNYLLTASTGVNKINPPREIKIDIWQGAIYAMCCSSAGVLTVMEVQSDG